MPSIFSRRTMLRSGICTAVAAAGGCADSAGPREGAREETADFLTPWSPPPDISPEVKAGPTAIRLASWSADARLEFTPGLDIAAQIGTIRSRGYTAACIVEGDRWRDASDNDVRALKDALAANDVVLFDVHTYTNNLHPDPAVREQNHRYVIRQCETADRLGASTITTHVGTNATETPIAPHRDNWTMASWRDGVAVMKKICRETAGMRPLIAIEPVNMTCMNNPRAFRRLLDDVADPRLKVCLDPVNMINLGVYFRTTELIRECFELLGNDIVSGHCKDTYILPDRMSVFITEVMPGKGTMDIAAYLEGLSRLDAPRPLLVEHGHSEAFPDWNDPRPKQYLDETAARIGVRFYG